MMMKCYDMPDDVIMSIININNKNTTTARREHHVTEHKLLIVIKRVNLIQLLQYSALIT